MAENKKHLILFQYLHCITFLNPWTPFYKNNLGRGSPDILIISFYNQLKTKSISFILSIFTLLEPQYISGPRLRSPIKKASSRPPFKRKFGLSTLFHFFRMAENKKVFHSFGEFVSFVNPKKLYSLYMLAFTYIVWLKKMHFINFSEFTRFQNKFGQFCILPNWMKKKYLIGLDI